MSPAGKATLGIAVAGAGVIGRRHIELIQANPRTRLCAVVDPQPASREFAASLGVPHFVGLDDLFAGPTAARPDGVILATPNHLHVPGALVCVQHRVPALIEKPVADSLEAGMQLAGVLAKQRTPMLVGHHRRHSSTLQAARRAIQSGLLGRVVTVTGSAQFYKPDSYFEQGPWRTQPGGGPILINLIHEMDNLRYLCGELESVYAVASSAVRQFAVEDTAVMTLKFASGALGTFTLSDTVASPRSWEQTSGKTRPTRATRRKTATSLPAPKALWPCRLCTRGHTGLRAQVSRAGTRLLRSRTSRWRPWTRWPPSSTISVI
jgi:predicted dehydrogenase